MAGKLAVGRWPRSRLWSTYRRKLPMMVPPGSFIHRKTGGSGKLLTLWTGWPGWLTHIPGRYEHTVRYYGYYSNKSRGIRKKAEVDGDIPAVIPNEMSSKESRQNWARLIQKIYEVDPLICPKCWGQMHIISFIEELYIIEKILRHLGLWDIRNHDPPQPVTSDSIPDLVYDFSDSQIPAVDYWN